MNKIDRYQNLRSNPEEYKKCQDNPLYFYNTYVKHLDDPEINEQEYNELKAKFKCIREGTVIGKRRNPFLKQYPMTETEAFNLTRIKARRGGYGSADLIKGSVKPDKHYYGFCITHQSYCFKNNAQIKGLCILSGPDVYS